MIDEIKAAVTAADNYVARNEHELLHVNFIKSALSDVETRAGFLDHYFHEGESWLRRQEADQLGAQAAAALAASQAPLPAPVAPVAPAPEPLPVVEG